jgi:hypothetical protein
VSESTPYVPCPADCDAGKVCGTRGYVVTGSGYGDAHPREVVTDCGRCEGEERVHVSTLTDDEWSRLGGAS